MRRFAAIPIALAGFACFFYRSSELGLLDAHAAELKFQLLGVGLLIAAGIVTFLTWRSPAK